MHAYTSNEANTEDGMAEASLKISVFVFLSARYRPIVVKSLLLLKNPSNEKWANHS